MVRFLTLIVALVMSNLAVAADYVINDNTVVCDTEKTYRAQIKHLVDGNRSLIKGCDITMGDTPVTLVDANASGYSHVEIILTGRQVWVGNNGIQSR